MLRTWLQIARLIFIGMLCFTGAAAGAEPAPAASEMLFGDGTPGPFSLAWTQVQFGTERLSVNGTSLISELDYRLDYERGTVTFAQPLRQGQIAQIDYRYDAAHAKPNHGTIPVPLQMRLWGSSGGGAQLIGGIQPGLAPGDSPSASLLGFRDEMALGGSQFSSLFLMAPEANGRLSANRWERAALQFGASRTTGPLQFRAALGQAGAGFSPASDYQLRQGLRTLDLSAVFDPSKRVSFSGQVMRQDALDASQKGSEQVSIKNQLALTPATGTKLTLSQESSTRARSQGPAERLDALRGQIEHHLGGTVATLLAERRQTDTTGTTTTAGIDLASHLMDQTRLTAGFVQNENDRQGRDSTARVGLELRATPQIGFHFGFNQHLSQKQGNSSGSDWGVTAGPHGLLAVEGQSSQRVAAGGQSQQEQQLRVEASPLRGVKVAQMSATHQVGQDAARETHETSLEVSPLSALRVTGAVRDEERADGVAHIRSVSGAIKPAPFLDLSGAYKTRDLPAGDECVTRAMQLALMPVHGFQLKGSYVQNPEDTDGRVLPATDASLGLESVIGSLTFGGSYTTGEGLDPAAGDGSTARQREQSEFRLALKLWGHSRLYSSYKEQEERSGSTTVNRTLSLGFTRSLSENFYLLLEGEMTEVEVNGIPQPAMCDQRAQAKLGLRF
jgi:hypothetical protein